MNQEQLIKIATNLGYIEGAITQMDGSHDDIYEAIDIIRSEVGLKDLKHN